MSFTGQRMEFYEGETTWCGTGITTPRQSQIGPTVNFGDICHIVTCSKECSEIQKSRQDFFLGLIYFSIFLLFGGFFSITAYQKCLFCVTFVCFFFLLFLLYIHTPYCHRLLHVTLHAVTDTFKVCCHILEKVHSVFDFVWMLRATTPASIKYTVDNHHLPEFCLCFGSARVAPALNHWESGCSRPTWLTAPPPLELCCFDDTAVAMVSIQSKWRYLFMFLGIQLVVMALLSREGYQKRVSYFIRIFRKPDTTSLSGRNHTTAGISGGDVYANLSHLSKALSHGDDMPYCPKTSPFIRECSCLLLCHSIVPD